ncbi:hypothetical protein Tco_1083366 [Tanacetum coccineum]
MENEEENGAINGNNRWWGIKTWILLIAAEACIGRNRGRAKVEIDVLPVVVIQVNSGEKSWLLLIAAKACIRRNKGRAKVEIEVLSVVVIQVHLGENVVRALPLEDVIGDVLKGKWDQERTKFSLPPLINLEETLKRQTDQSENANKEAKDKLEVALRELEKAKAAESLASDQIHKRTKDSGSFMNINKIKPTTQEYEALRRKGNEAGKASDAKVATTTVLLIWDYKYQWCHGF